MNRIIHYHLRTRMRTFMSKPLFHNLIRARISAANFCSFAPRQTQLQMKNTAAAMANQRQHNQFHINLVSSAVQRTLDKSHSSTLNYCFNLKLFLQKENCLIIINSRDHYSTALTLVVIGINAFRAY